MCTLIGILSENSDITDQLILGLQSAPSRDEGDWAGIATVYGGCIEQTRIAGRVDRLGDSVDGDDLPGRVGVAQHRMRHHASSSRMGIPLHANERVAIVQSGIIKNEKYLRHDMAERGAPIPGNQSREIIPHMVDFYLKKGLSPDEATARTVHALSGGQDLIALFADDERTMVALCQNESLYIGLGEGGYQVTSNKNALGPCIDRVMRLYPGDQALITMQGISIHDPEGFTVRRSLVSHNSKQRCADQGNRRRYAGEERRRSGVVASSKMAPRWGHIESI